MGRFGAVLALFFVATSVSADELHLRSGGRLHGIIVTRTTSAVEIEVSAGRITVPHQLIARIVEGESSLARYQMRVRELAPDDVLGWLALAEYARSAELSGQARDAYQHVLQIDPDNAGAHAALGHRRVESQWMTRDDAMEAQGFVRFEGEWVQPGYRDTVLAARETAARQGAEAEQARLALAEAEARAREAEARARAAEADAQRAADERDSAGFVVGTGLWGVPVAGTYVVGGNPHCHRSPWTTFATTTTIIPGASFSFRLGTGHGTTRAHGHTRGSRESRSTASERNAARPRASSSGVGAPSARRQNP